MVAGKGNTGGATAGGGGDRGCSGDPERRGGDCARRRRARMTRVSGWNLNITNRANPA